MVLLCKSTTHKTQQPPLPQIDADPAMHDTKPHLLYCWPKRFFYAYVIKREKERDVGLILCIMYSILHFKSFCIPRWECSKPSQPTNKFLLSIVTTSGRD